MSLLVFVARVRRLPALLSAVALSGLLATSAYAANAVGPTLLPAGSLGYVHVQVTDLNQTPFARFPVELLGRVHNELANLTTHTLGVDVTQLAEVTVVVPPLEVLQSHQSSAPPVVIAATFNNRFNPEEIANGLAQGWQEANVGDAKVYTAGDGTTLYAASPRTLLFGAQDTIAWWIEAQKQPQDSTLPELLRESLGTGQVFLGFNLSTIPAEARANLPPQLNAVLHAQLATLKFDLKDTTTVAFDLGYGNEKDAAQAKQELSALQKQGHAILSFQEAEFQRQLEDANGSLDHSMESLFALAFTRQLDSYLDTIKLTQQDAWVTTSLSVKADPSTFAVAAIAAIGSAAKESPATLLEDTLGQSGDEGAIDEPAYDQPTEEGADEGSADEDGVDVQ